MISEPDAHGDGPEADELALEHVIAVRVRQHRQSAGL